MGSKGVAKLREIVTTLNAKGKGIPESISQLEPFPARTFSELQSGFFARRFTVFKFSTYYDSELFALTANHGMKLKYWFGTLLTIVGPVAAFVACFFVSWWLLLAVPVAFFMGLRMTRNAYQIAIFAAAFEAEISFCLLYFYRQVGVNDMTTGRGYYWNAETNSSAIT